MDWQSITPLAEALKPLIGGSGVGLLMLLIWWRTGGQKSDTQTRADELEDKRVLAVFVENDRLRERLDRIEAECERGWSLARGWCARCHTVWHALANTVQSMPPHTRPGMPDTLPALEQIEAVDSWGLPIRYSIAPPERPRS